MVMTIPNAVIQDSVARYERERDRYLKLAARVADICRTEIVEGNAVRAQVTSRAKTAKSFEGKLRRFSKRADKNFQAAEDVFLGIGDFAGVRIATYREEDEKVVVTEILKYFCGPNWADVSIERKDRIADGSFYRATHCQAFLLDDELVGTYENLRGTRCEIQVCSMMAHAWNEIEHDIGYKPEGGGPQEAERGLLKALGQLTRSGDEVISRLLEANIARLEAQTGEFAGVHGFIARLRSLFPRVDLSTHAGQLFEEIESLGFTSLEELLEEIGEAELSPENAEKQFDDFNSYLKNAPDGQEYQLDRNSSDLILVLLLNKYFERIEANHPIGRGKGRPPRIRSIATHYRDYKGGQRR
jgi:ppGpp synthetase/RelA/SpoT-type nucleotidyltranferase